MWFRLKGFIRSWLGAFLDHIFQIPGLIRSFLKLFKCFTSAETTTWPQLRVSLQSYGKAHCPKLRRHECVDNDMSSRRRLLISNYWAAAKTVWTRVGPGTMNRPWSQIQTVDLHHRGVFLKRDSVFLPKVSCPVQGFPCRGNLPDRWESADITETWNILSRSVYNFFCLAA